MLFINETDKGRISYKKSIIADIALSAMEKTEGKVRPSYTRLKSLVGIKDFVECEVFGEAYDINLYVDLVFGSSISEMADIINTSMRSDVRDITGMSIRKLTLIILTMTSGKNTVKRGIEVSFYA